MLYDHIGESLPFEIFLNAVSSLTDGEVVAISHFFIEFSPQFRLAAAAIKNHVILFKGKLILKSSSIRVVFNSE